MEGSGWKAFEEAVAAIQSLFTPTAKVTHNVQIVDRLGHSRQFDVVINDQWGALPILGVIECKDWKTRVDVTEIDAFHTKSQGVRANLSVIVSRSGFTDTAIDAAKHYGIGTLSLLPVKQEAGFRIGFQSFARIYAWRDTMVTIHFADAKAQFTNQFAADRVLCDGQPILKWWLRELAVTHKDVREVGWHGDAVRFNVPRELEFDGERRMAAGIEFRSLLVANIKTKFIGLTGQAFWDWQTRQIRIPGKGSLVSDVIDTQFADWEDVEGDVPDFDQQQTFGVSFEAVLVLYQHGEPVIDLKQL